MIGIAPLRFATVAGAFVLLVAGCSSEQSDTGSQAPTSTVTVTASSSAAPDPEGSDDAGPTEGQTADTIEAGDPAPATGQQPSGPLPAADFADGNGYGFSSPTGKIQCRAADDRMICQTPNQGHAVAATAVCGFYPGEEQPRATQFGYFPGGGRPCATIIQGNFFTTPRALNYGQSVVFSIDNGRRITCSSATAGLTCRGSDGSGFFLSGESFRVL
ncbi:hypothetical protein [Williamsia sp.]|uniref:hypothetical protein n=1 Tax=Williamsia sp. TaxID=1872085 RepID=UPI001A185D34|nr:hypothetical protein [Williamsia sp.]MBJ7291259.1 hypothetical protein [Williamsia sp.]